MFYEKKHSPFYKSLNGNWNFMYFDRLMNVPEDIFTPEALDYDWEEIAVPSAWELFGYGDIVYTDGLDFPYDPPHIPHDNSTGAYMRAFVMPQSWSDEKVYINFESVSSCFKLYINGLFAGENEGTFAPCSFEITKLLNPGENFLTVVAAKYSAASYDELYEGFKFSGILGDVYLTAGEMAEFKSVASVVPGKIRIKGVAYDMFDCDKGYYMPEKELFEELIKIKANNLNAVYLKRPCPKILYELCGKAGLYILTDKTGLKFVNSDELDKIKDGESFVVNEWCDKAISVKYEDGTVDYIIGKTGTGLISDKAETESLCKLKKIACPFEVAYDENKILIKNKEADAQTAVIAYEVVSDGKALCEKTAEISVSGKRTKSIKVDMDFPENCRFGCSINVKISDDFAENAWSFPILKGSVQTVPAIHCLEAEQDKESIVVYGNDFTYVLSTVYGSITSAVKDGKEYGGISFKTDGGNSVHIYSYDVPVVSDEEITVDFCGRISDNNSVLLKFDSRYSFKADGSIEISAKKTSGEKSLISEVVTDKGIRNFEYFSGGSFAKTSPEAEFPKTVKPQNSFKKEADVIHAENGRGEGIEISGGTRFFMQPHSIEAVKAAEKAIELEASEHTYIYFEDEEKISVCFKIL